LFAIDPEGLDRRADALATIVNDERGEAIARVERPFARRFPLDGANVGRGFYAGHLPGKRPVLVVQEGQGKRPVLIHFDADGHLQSEKELDLSEKLLIPPAHSWQEVDEQELIAVLGREVGFEPGPIFVREFDAELAQTNLSDHANYPLGSDEDDSAHTWWLWSTGQFLLDDGNFWLDRVGCIHST
jgi:hypothetical protein